jgi:hypothetical protein
MMYRCLLAAFIIFFIYFQKSAASDFEGNITLVKQTFYDTTYLTFTVKDKLVRIDEKNAKYQVMQSLIIDTEHKNITALSPSQKLYTTIQKIKDVPNLQSGFVIIKTENFKYIEGYKCFLWRVRNSNLNLEISFWVFESNFGFFNDVIALLSQTEDYSRYCLYFNQIPDTRGFFPMLMVEKTLLRDEKMKVTVQHINRKKVDDKQFQIPGEYKYLRF